MMHSTSSSDLASPRSIQWRNQLGLSTEESFVELRLAQYQQYRQEYPFPQPLTDEACLETSSDAVSSSTNHSTQVTNEESVSSPNNDLDPLTAMMMEEQQRTTRLQEMDLKYRKERARRKRGTTSSGNIVEDEDYDEAVVFLVFF